MKFWIYLLVFFGIFIIQPFADASLKEIERLEKALDDNPHDMKLLKSLGIQFHDLTASGNLDGARDAVRFLEEAYNLDMDPETKCWLGSAWTLVSRDSSNPIVKLDAIAKGLKMIDEAAEEVDKAPEIYIVPFIRIQNSYELPEEFSRRELVDRDFQFLLITYKRTPKVIEDLFDPGEIFLFKGLYLLRDNKVKLAYKFWKAGYSAAKTDRVRNAIRENMQGIEGDS